jgi:hypothetical protein
MTGHLLGRGRAPRRMGIPWTSSLAGVGIIGAWFAAGIWIYSRTRFLGARQPPDAGYGTL